MGRVKDIQKKRQRPIDSDRLVLLNLASCLTYDVVLQSSQVRIRNHAGDPRIALSIKSAL